MLEAALRWPGRGEAPLKTVLIGGVLVLTSFLVVPGLILYGYYLEALRAALEDREAPPPVRDPGGLLVDGLLVVVVSLAYALVPIVLFLVGATTVGLGVARGGGSGAAAGVLGLLVVVVTALVALAVGYVVPAALVALAERRSVSAAFDVRQLADVVLTERYAVAWVVAALVAIVGGAIAGALVAILVGFAVQFYVTLAALHIFGRAYADATGRAAAAGE